MAKVSTTNPAFDKLGNTHIDPGAGRPNTFPSSLRAESLYKPRAKTPPASPKRVVCIGVSDKVSEKHKNFKRRDTPRIMNLAPTSNSYKPKLQDSFEECEGESN